MTEPMSPQSPAYTALVNNKQELVTIAGSINSAQNPPSVLSEMLLRSNTEDKTDLVLTPAGMATVKEMGMEPEALQRALCK
jgi:hypothetical protein|eukprot:CAMPEP_0174378064 /NCGR_PEP_ID=MMETSP0811_2-20130205/121819_1 /TAXON_ID=73025 ORGANISM="Eutreptiella gymnastica-like, Strain CCMP1594" /NCGR_SAMPLE_ID=MMETSP0811_2 /ASSEMBLY_ACC=CAM_ASM_000667 /LENGTH=80 /DNA_ID=CAMNT_0015530191 /DNA_START=34 /DNA_END=276 /DNA_ORIENTATION=-